MSLINVIASVCILDLYKASYFVDHLSVELVELAYWLEIVCAGAEMGFV